MPLSKKNIYTFIFLTIMLIACSSQEERPNDVLSEKQMAEVIVAIETTQALYKLKFANKDTVNYTGLIDQTLKPLNTSKKQFNTSLVYYGKFPKKVESFYNEAIIRLTEKQAKLQPQLNVKN